MKIGGGESHLFPNSEIRGESLKNRSGRKINNDFMMKRQANV